MISTIYSLIEQKDYNDINKVSFLKMNKEEIASLFDLDYKELDFNFDYSKYENDKKETKKN